MQKGFTPILLIVGVGVILALGGVLVLTLTDKSRTTKNTVNPVPSTTVARVVNTPRATLKPTTSNGKQRTVNDLLLEPKAEIPSSWETYKDPRFTIRFPNQWRATTNPVVGGGSYTLVKPAYLVKDEYYPSIAITASNGSIDAILSKDIPLYKEFGLIQSNVQLQEFHAVKLSGTLSKSVLGDKMVDKPSQETQYYLAIGMTSYIIKYKYDGNQVDQKQEALFTQMISTLQFTPQ